MILRIPTIDDVLNDHATVLRDDFIAYRNHVYRIVNLCVEFVGRSELEIRCTSVRNMAGSRFH